MNENTVTFQAAEEKGRDIILHPRQAEALGLMGCRTVTLCFGNLRCTAAVTLSGDVMPGKILLSQTLFTKLRLPSYPAYELMPDKNSIVIGPCVGLLISEKGRRLTAGRLEHLTEWLGDYDRLHGAVIVFGLDKVDTAARLVEGYCYDPGEKTFQKGIFPYPSAIYRTIGLTPRWKDHFLSVIGDRLFNSRYFNKWEMYQWLSQVPGLNTRIPRTVYYHSPQDIFDLCADGGMAYVKPLAGLKGRGIIRVHRDDQGRFVFESREEDGNSAETAANRGEAEEYLRRHLGGGRYLAQQAVNLIRVEGRLIDFRCIMQKNQACRWVCKAVIGRIGDTGSVVSNISSGGKAFRVSDLRSAPVPLSTRQISHLEWDLSHFALDACDALDRAGVNCGTLGVDVGVDPRGGLWLLEINVRDPDPSISLNIGDVRLYHELRSGPLFYAKALAGFRSE